MKIQEVKGWEEENTERMQVDMCPKRTSNDLNWAKTSFYTRKSTSAL